VQPTTQHGYTGGIAIGYSQLMNPQYFLGAELSANKDGSSASFQSGASSTVFSDQVRMNGHFDLTFMPGLMLSNSIAAYLKLGLSYALLQDSLTSPVGFAPTITSYNNNQNAFGFAAGLGFSKAITDKVEIFTEADYHDYGSIGFANFKNYEANYTHSTHVYSYDVVVGAAYSIR
jgi:opacity protein-like surface antigen